MSCACAAGPTTLGAPLARALFGRVESDGQSVAEAARALGLGRKDAAHLLAGLRRDVAVEVVATLLATTASDGIRRAGQRQHCCGTSQPTDRNGEAP